MTIISYNQSFAFIHIQKCGGTSIEAEWSKYIRWNDFVIGSTQAGEELQPVFRQLYGIEKHMTARQLASVLGAPVFAGMRSLAVIREPLKIIESDYKFAHEVFGNFVDSLCRDPAERGAMAARVKAAVQEPNHPRIPQWWYQHHRGSIIDAILSPSFEGYLARVADDRWHRKLADFVCDEQSRVMVNHVLKLEEPDTIVRFFRETLGLGDFNLRWYNKGKALKLDWPSDLRRRFREICAADYELFRYP